MKLASQCTIPVRVIGLKKWLFDVSLLNTEYYKVRIKGKWGKEKTVHNYMESSIPIKYK